MCDVRPHFTVNELFLSALRSALRNCIFLFLTRKKRSGIHASCTKVSAVYAPIIQNIVVQIMVFGVILFFVHVLSFALPPHSFFLLLLSPLLFLIFCDASENFSQKSETRSHEAHCGVSLIERIVVVCFCCVSCMP